MIHRYVLRIESSICEVVDFKEGAILKSAYGVTSDIVVTCRSPRGVLMAHMNPNDSFEKRVSLVFIDLLNERPDLPEKMRRFEFSPGDIFTFLRDGDGKRFFYQVNLSDMIPVYPNIVRSEKILNDGETYAVAISDHHVTDLSPGPVTPEEQAHLGHVTSFDLTKENPIEVTYTNGSTKWYKSSDLVLFHEV